MIFEMFYRRCPFEEGDVVEFPVSDSRNVTMNCSGKGVVKKIVKSFADRIWLYSVVIEVKNF